MNGEHLQDVRGGGAQPLGEANGALDESKAVSMILAAYDHVLFHPWKPGEESAWSAALQELLGARARILSAVIPLRLRSYRSVPAEAVQ